MLRAVCKNINPLTRCINSLHSVSVTSASPLQSSMVPQHRLSSRMQISPSLVLANSPLTMVQRGAHSHALPSVSARRLVARLWARAG